MSRRVINSR